MAPADKQSGATQYDLQPLEDALVARGLEGIYTRDFMQKLSDDTAKLRSGELSLAEVKDTKTGSAWLRNTLTSEVNPPNPGLRTYSGHWYNSYLRIAAYGYGRGPDLLVEAHHKDGRIEPPDHAFDPSKTCSPVQLTSHAPHQDDQLTQKQQNWAACNDLYAVSKTRALLQLQIALQHLQSGGPRVDKVVCMGLGSLTRQTGSLNGLDAWFRPYSQHIVALSIAQALDELYDQHYERYGEDKSKVRVLAQDPGYSNSDKQILVENDITVLEDPEGLLAIDENTFVISAFPSFPLYEIIADMLPAGPAAIFDASLPISVTDTPVSSSMQYNEFAAPRVKKMLQGWQAHELRWDEQELLDMNQKLKMAVDWLPRMRLFLKPNDSSWEGDNEKVTEDILRRRNRLDEMVPSGVKLLRQRILRLINL
ncbi:uncharacterized protein N0V89_007726 [Didymosphaeria variabile]|uniref:SRR1-like domain-containing protein n=1 Tax=Didymosphaeria variabile TaxID=1932322 RepID=A0A9W8XJE1_9PLEO|nr:uncharacterized protein N0V89_007726 [Didymosphaeria variabile]KAJ4352378.1 hypothetical protein N0V89_007726 [Didymosphaeria variabile]